MKEADKPPFAAHRTYYTVLKIAVLIVAVLLAYRYLLGG